MASALGLRTHVVASGVYQCRWHIESAMGTSRTQDAVLVEVAHAAPPWHLLGDILITPVCGDVASAAVTARALAVRCPCCALVVAPVGGATLAIVRQAVLRYSQLLTIRDQRAAVPAEAACGQQRDPQPADIFLVRTRSILALPPGRPTVR